jgi:Abnormal spindle-like microcephaly-assoc'd, ASPM-SPD-2-Hydin
VKEFGTRGKLVAVLLSLATTLGCGALEASQPAAQTSTGLVATSPVLNFGTVPVGSTGVLTNTIVNKSKSPIVVTRAQVDQTDFQISGQKLPLTLAPGQRTVVQVAYSPQSTGRSQGRVVLASNLIRSTPIFTMSGTAFNSSRIKLDPSSFSFGNVQMGKTQTRVAALSNPGQIAITITQVVISQKGFSLTGLTLPMTLRAGQSVLVGVNFTPTANGAVSGTISLNGTVPLRVAKQRPVAFGGREPETVFAVHTLPTAFNVAVSGTGVSSGQLVVSPASLALGNVKLGGSQTQSITLTNSSSASVTVSQATVSGKGFGMSGITFPLTLAAGERKSFTVTFAPQSAGSAAGSIAVVSDASNSVVSVPVSALATGPGTLASNPASLSFGTVQVGQGQTLSETLTNSGSSSVTVSQANLSGSGFSMTGLSLPLTLAAGQSAAFSVTFKPQSGGPVSSALTLTSDASNAALTVPITGSGVTAGSLVSAPATLSFGSVQASSPKTIAETLTNSGGSSISITQANISGAGFTLSGLTLPVTLAAGQNTTFNVIFTPQSGGSASGNLSIVSNASNPSLSIPLAASSATPGVLSTSDSSLTFGSVPVNGSATQSETLTNTGGTSVTVTQATVSGSAFRTSGLSLPLTLSPGQSFTFGAVFSPTTGGSITGSISVVSDASDSTLTISLAGTATVPGQLAVSPASLSFGTVTVGQTISLPATLTASGSSITVTAASMTTSEFKVSGLSLPLTLAAGQSASFTVTFAPQSSGTASASGSFTSNASNSSVVQTLTGSGAAAPQHSVALSWTPSTANVVAYNVYRGTSSGGSYTKISAMNATTSYLDDTVQAGQTYVYVTTAVDGSGNESANSNQALAVVPTP